jgi:hypothetical protein
MLPKVDAGRAMNNEGFTELNIREVLTLSSL